MPKPRRVTLERSLCAVAGATLTALVASDSRAADSDAEPAMRNHFLFGGGVATTFFQGGTDGYFTEKGVAQSYGRVAYSYYLLRGLDVGGDLHFFTGYELLPAVSIRGYLPLGADDAVELGLSGHLGMLILERSPRTWLGWSTSAGPDVRVWISETVAVQLSGEAAYGTGSSSGRHEVPSDSFVKNDLFLALGGSLSLVWRH
jgi:hypothetical protein